MEDVGLLDFLGDVLWRLVRGDEGEGVGGAAWAEALDGAQVVAGDDGVDLAVDEEAPVGYLSQGYDVAAADLWLHGVARDVAPAGGPVVGREVDHVRGGHGLVVVHLVESAYEVYVVVWHALFTRRRAGARIFFAVVLQYVEELEGGLRYYSSAFPVLHGSYGHATLVG